MRKKLIDSVTSRQLRNVILALVSAAVFFACSSDDGEQEEKKPGQALARVNGVEITIHQLNDELRRTGVQAGQHEAASKQILESLINRQLTLAEGVSNKLDRTPDVMQAIERAKAQIVAQTYLQGVVSKVISPSKTEIDEYFQKHPEFFAQRKQIDMTLLLIAAKDLSDELKAFLDAEKSPSENEVIAWLNEHNTDYRRNRVSRSTADMPQQMTAELLKKGKDHIFIVNEQNSSSLIFVDAINDSPVTAAAAAPQIERFLLNKKHQEAVETEIARLRSSAEIEYVGTIVPEVKEDESANITDIDLLDATSDETLERGLKGLVK